MSAIAETRDEVQEQVRAEIATLETGTSRLLHWSEQQFEVLTDEQERNAEDLLIGLRQAEKVADEKRREILRPIDEARAKVQALFRPYLDNLGKARASITKGLTVYQDEKRKAAEEARILLLEEQAQRIAEAKETGEIVEAPMLAPDELPTVAKTSHANLGSVTYREDIEVTIVNLRLIPRDLMLPDMAKIKARVKSGMEVPGVLVTKKMIPVTRATS